MVSAAGDGYGAYGKESLIKLAASEPDKARLTANSYMLYAAQAGMPHSEYDSATSLWGGSMNADGTCQDKYSNCAELGSSASMCAHGSVSSGETIGDACCHSCTQDVPTNLFADPVEFTNNDAGGHISGMGKCSSSQLSKLQRGIDQAAPFIKKAIDNRDTAAWTKWFGAATSQQTNADVQTRLNDGYKQVTSSDWEPRCCASQGSTDQECANNCQGNTMAFVQSYTYQGSDKEYQYEQIQFCASAFSATDVQLGLIAFHESVHMVSAAGDGYGAYGKESLIKLAASEPDKARLTANSYMLYAAQAGMPHSEYDSATSLWGGSMNADGTCQDKYSNCAELGSSASTCAHGSVGSGETIGDACCHSCTQDVPTNLFADPVEFTNNDSSNHIGMGKCSSSQVSKLKRG